MPYLVMSATRHAALANASGQNHRGLPSTLYTAAYYRYSKLPSLLYNGASLAEPFAPLTIYNVINIDRNIWEWEHFGPSSKCNGTERPALCSSCTTSSRIRRYYQLRRSKRSSRGHCQCLEKAALL